MNGRVINAMRDMALSENLDLELLHRHLTGSKYHRGRPQMLVVTMTNGRNLQLFRRGKIQILGNISHSDAHWMCYDILQQIKTYYPNLKMTTLTLRNLVVSVQLKNRVALHKIRTSSNNLFYESELFPAALIRKWHPIHISLFHNGNCILTGLADIQQVSPIIDELVSFLSDHHLLYQ